VLKGFAAPARVWRPVAERTVLDRFLAFRRPEAPLAGRGAELAQLTAAWAAAVAGQGRCVVVSGDAGIGKSRLVAELRRGATGASGRLLQCQPQGENQPLHPLTDLLRSELGDLAALNRAEWAGQLAEAGFSVPAEGLDELAAFSGAGAERSASDLLTADLSGARFRTRVIGAAAAILVPHDAPALLVIEDLHWADSLTRALVQRLAAIAAGGRLLLLVTQRQAPGPDLTGLPGVEVLPLTGLAASAMPDLVASVWPSPPDPPEGIASFAYAKSDGLPLYAEELLAFLRQRLGDTPADPASWQSVWRESGIASLNDLVAAHLADLGPARRTAQIASVLGREFGLATLARILERPADDERLGAELQTLVSHGVLQSSDEGDPVFRFRHALLQEAAYASLLKADRRQIHARIVATLRGGDAPDIPDDLAARHCIEAGVPAEAAHYAIRAAEACVIRCAMSEADSLLRLAEDQLAALPEDAGRTKRMVQVLELRGVVAAALHGRGSPETRAVYEAAVELCRGRGEAAMSEHFALYWGWWFTAPDFATQQVRSRILLDDMENVADAEVRLQSLHCAWATSFHGGRHDFCLDCVRKGLALYDPERAARNRARYGGHDARACGLGERALSLWFQDDPGGSDAAIRDCLAWAEAIDHVGSLFHALDYAVVLSRYREDYAGVLRYAARMEEIATVHAMPGGRAKALLFGGWAEAMAGDAATGLRRFQEGYDLQRRIGTEENLPIFTEMRAGILARTGRPAEALPLMEDAIAKSQAVGQLFWLAELYRARAALAGALGQPDALVRADLLRARDTAREQGALALVGRADADLAALGTAREAE
jgi:predicted ATPase